MSSGDIDNQLGPAGTLGDLRHEHKDLHDYLQWAWSLAPVTTFFIPFGAGISEDGKRVYVSYDLQTVVAGIDCVSALVRHETTEWALREFCGIGEDYLTDPTGHRLANRAESEHVSRLLNREDAWELYSEIIDPQIILEERTDIEGKPVPEDLAMYPYDEELQEVLQAEMGNARSREEWEKLQ